MILRFWHQTNESEYNKIVFLVGLLSNQWEQFIDLANGYDLTTLGTINCIEELTNYRDFNIQIINRYFESEYDVSELSYLKLCAPKAHDILQNLQRIRGGSEKEFNDAKKLVNGICRLKYPGRAQKSYAYMKHALQTYPEEMKKYWDLCMLSLDATSYKKTIIINLQSEIRKRSIEAEEIKLWMPVFRFYEELEVYYYLLAARYALDRKIEDAKNAYAFISSQDILPREWAEDIRMKIAFSSEARLKLKSRMRCVIAGDKLSEAVETEIEEIISTDGNVREILAVVAQILEENNCQVWYLFDEFQQIVERWQGDTIELTEICNDIMNHQNSIKLVLCGSDDLVRLYECENDENWRGFVQKTADNRVQIGQLSEEDFSDMMRDESIWGDVSINDPWSPEALNLLYQYTGGNAICGKLFGNELINKIRRGDFNTREKLYPSDITQVAYELLNSEVGLVKNLLVLHNTKNLEEEIPYLLFIAHELIQDKNRATVSIRRIREFFSVKSPTSIDNALKILIARGILKSNNDRQRYGFSTMFYFDFFRSQATEEKINDLSVRLQEEGKAKENAGDDKIDPLSLQFVRQYFRDATPEVQNEFLAGLAVNAKDKEALKGLIGTTQSGNIFNAETTFNQVNIQSITNTLNGIMTTSDPALLFKGIQELPRLSNYLPTLADDSGEIIVSDDSISRAMDNYVADMEESLDGLRVRVENEECDTEISYSAILGVSDDEYEEFMEQYNLPEFFMRSLGFAYQLDGLFMKGAVGNDTDMIDFSPVTIMYCKLIESLLKEYHISIYGKCFETLDTDMRRPENREEKYKWKEIDMLPVTQQQRLTIGSFVFPLYKKWAIDKLVKVTGKETDEWVEHKKMVMAVKDIRNPSAHGNKDHRITLEQKKAITEMLFSNHGFMRLIELALG